MRRKEEGERKKEEGEEESDQKEKKMKDKIKNNKSFLSDFEFLSFKLGICCVGYP
jgi:hypothetical protein